jgi:hypothetical protein
MIKKYITRNKFKVTSFKDQGYMISKDDEIIEIHPFTKLRVLNPSSLFYAGVTNLQGEYETTHLVDHADSYGIDSERMKRYLSWINKDGTCGMMSAAVLLAYYQDYIDETIIPPSIRTKGSSSPENLYKTLMKDISSFSPVGTIAYDVSMGINRFLRRQETNHLFKAKGSLTPTFGIVKTRLEQSQPKPSIIGLNKYLNAPKNYGNHWVVAYRILELDNQKYYQVHDNHGRYNAIINARWTVGIVRLLKK